MSDKKTILLHVLCILTVMASALTVRTPSAALVDVSGTGRESYTDENGLPYFTDMDSYYHARLVDDYMKNGYLGDAVSDDGKPWDTRSFYPEGRSAEYPKGIVLLTLAVWRLANLFGHKDIGTVEFMMPVIMSMFTAAVAYMAGCRMSTKAGGLVSGIIAGCGSLFVSRTTFGRFDTDAFVVCMNILLIFFMTEALLAENKRSRVIFIIGFLVSVMLYAGCWNPRNILLFSGVTLLGGFLYVVSLFFVKEPGKRASERLRSVLSSGETRTLIITGLLTVVCLMIVSGYEIFGEMIASALSYTNASSSGNGELPNLFVSVSELKKVKISPDSMAQWLSGCDASGEQTLVNGVGGMPAFFFAMASLVYLGILFFKRLQKEEDDTFDGRRYSLYFTVLGMWLITGIYSTRSGIRFVEVLSVPVSLLAAISTGRLVCGIHGSKRINKHIYRILAAAIILAVTFPAFLGAALSAAKSIPSVSDASANAMSWIRNNAEDPDAVLESWWDMGYYYEAEAGHPCLWDGGSQDGVRAILYSRAMTAKDMEEAYRILYMLACSGNKAVDMLMEHTDAATSFEVIWEALMLDRDRACELIEDKCGMSADEAARAEELIHPAPGKETYLILTYTMTKQLGWYEYYADWDFTGTQELPDATWYSYMPDGTPVFLTEKGQEYLEEKRADEIMWRLFFNAEENPYFIPAFEWHDGVEHVRIWRVK